MIVRERIKVSLLLVLILQILMEEVIFTTWMKHCYPL